MHSGRHELIGVEEFAAELGVSVRYVRRVIAERRITYIKVGHLIRFERAEVDRWLETNRVSSMGPAGFSR